MYIFPFSPDKCYHHTCPSFHTCKVEDGEPVCKCNEYMCAGDMESPVTASLQGAEEEEESHLFNSM